MKPSFLLKRARDQGGGAMVEFAVCTIALVPIILYGIWFSDAMHFGAVAEEASIEPAFDATAYLGHSDVSSTKYFTSIAQKRQAAVEKELKASYDSFAPGASPKQASLFVDPKSLKVTCTATTQGAYKSYDVQKYASSLLPTGQTWVTCSSQVQLNTNHLFPSSYRDSEVHQALYPHGLRTFDICGAGPGLRGCPSNKNGGFSILLDDWALEDSSGGNQAGRKNPLSIGNSGSNQGYVNVGKDFFNNSAGRANGLAMAAIMRTTMAVFQFPVDMAPRTTSYRLTYQVTGNGAYSATEGGHEESNPLGGPPNPRTGGPWLDEHSAHPNMHQKVFGVRKNRFYMAVKGWAAD